MPKRNLDIVERRGSCEHTKAAQVFVDAAYASVKSAIESMDKVRELRPTKTRKTSNTDQDLLRSAIVFAGAGLDASLKQLIRDALEHLIGDVGSTLAEEKFHDFVARAVIPGAQPPNVLIKVLTSRVSTPREALVELYIEDLTGGSLQSVERVSEVLAALGIDDAALRKRVAGSGSRLREVFRARNRIVHELDLRHHTDVGRGIKEPRKIRESCELATEALSVAQMTINAVNDLLC